MATLSGLAQTVDLRRILEKTSTLVGCPVILTDAHGGFLSVPGCHPARCPLQDGPGSAGCPVARRIMGRFRPLQGVGLVDFKGARHVVAPVRVAGRLQGLVIADGWAMLRPRRRRQVSALRLDRMRSGVALATTVLGQLLRVQRSVDLASAGGSPREQDRVSPGPEGRMPSDTLRRAVSQGWMSPWGIARLREEYRLTWREIEILTLYYLAPSWWWSEDENPNTRRILAKHLRITDGTLRAYLNGIRGKLGLRARRGALAFWRWAKAERILSPDCSP